MGTNQYPNQDEKIDKPFEKLQIIAKPEKGKTFIGEPLKTYRAAEAFEELRLKTEKNKTETTSVFLFTYGNLTMRKARASFSSNFFACAGFNIEDNFGFETLKKGQNQLLDIKDIEKLMGSGLSKITSTYMTVRALKELVI